MEEIVVVNMSKVYEREDFYRPFINSDNIIECSDIEGTNCYIDNEALSAIRKRLKNVDARGIHFIDSGNYHYLSYLFLEKIPREFELILIFFYILDIKFLKDFNFSENFFIQKTYFFFFFTNYLL